MSCLANSRPTSIHLAPRYSLPGALATPFDSPAFFDAPPPIWATDYSSGPTPSSVRSSFHPAFFFRRPTQNQPSQKFALSRIQPSHCSPQIGQNLRYPTTCAHPPLAPSTLNPPVLFLATPPLNTPSTFRAHLFFSRPTFPALSNFHYARLYPTRPFSADAQISARPFFHRLSNVSLLPFPTTMQNAPPYIFHQPSLFAATDFHAAPLSPRASLFWPLVFFAALSFEPPSCPRPFPAPHYPPNLPPIPRTTTCQ